MPRNGPAPRDYPGRSSPAWPRSTAVPRNIGGEQVDRDGRRLGIDIHGRPIILDADGSPAKTQAQCEHVRRPVGMGFCPRCGVLIAGNGPQVEPGTQWGILDTLTAALLLAFILGIVATGC